MSLDFKAIIDAIKSLIEGFVKFLQAIFNIKFDVTK